MSFYEGSLLFTAATSAALGVFVYYCGRRKPPNIALALLSLSIAAWSFGQFMGEIAASQAEVLCWTRFNIAAAVFIPVLYFHFVVAFSQKQKENAAVVVIAYVSAGLLLLLDLTPLFVAGIVPRPGYRFYPLAGPVYPVFAVYLMSLFLQAFIKLLGLIRSGGPLANQAKYVLAASAIGVAGGLTAFFPLFNLNWPVVSQFALPVYLSIIVFAIVRHRLLDINIVLRAGLVYSTLTVVFAGFYSLVIIFTNEIFRNLAGSDELVVMLAVVFLSVLVFQPIRDRVQNGVDRLFFRGSYYYAGLAHEIRNPLASIKGLTQVLPENLDDQDFIDKYSAIVPRQLDRINRIVEDLLVFGQPGKLKLEKVDISFELNEVLRLVENQCRAAKIEIVRSFAAAAPVTGSAEKLSQAFMNVILNAIQSMPGGGVLKLITYNLLLITVVEITDTGEGIPADQLPNIFDPFYTTKENGTGMGLAVTHRIIKEHDGELEVSSETGKGTTFKLCLPIRPRPSAYNL
jgi:signal transduction histidine kinase